MSRERPAILLESAAGPEVVVDGARLIYLGGTNYLGLNRHPEVIHALEKALEIWGISPGAGRTTSGTSKPHLELEECLRTFLKADAVSICASGYQGNTVLVQTCREAFDVCVVDELAHSSILDAARSCALPIEHFGHRDVDACEQLVRRHRAGGRRALIATDGVFATNGVLAPLKEYRKLAQGLELGLLVDDAHAIGVLGPRGSGTPEHLGFGHAGLFSSGSFSKALGVFGGFAAGAAELHQRVQQSGTYVGATPLPPALCIAVRKALEIAAGDGTLRARLSENSALVKEGLRGLGIEFPDSPMPIARFVAGSAEEGRALHRELCRRGVLIPFNTYPGGPATGYFRLAVSAAHTREHLERALEALAALL